MPMPDALCKWLLTEASSGTTPTRVADWSPNPVQLAITYGTGTPASWSSIAAGNGWGVTKAAITANLESSTLGGTKIKSTLDGTRTLTVQLAINRTAGPSVSYDFPIIFAMYSDGTQEDFVVYDRVAGNFLVVARMSATNRTAGNFTAPSPGVKVVTMVIDSTQGTQANRFRVYFDNIQQTVTGCTIGLNETFSIDATGQVHVSGINVPSEPSPDVIYYAMVMYAGALTLEQVSDTAGALLANNDSDPTIKTVSSRVATSTTLTPNTRMLA